MFVICRSDSQQQVTAVARVCGEQIIKQTDRGRLLRMLPPGRTMALHEYLGCASYNVIFFDKVYGNAETEWSVQAPHHFPNFASPLEAHYAKAAT